MPNWNDPFYDEMGDETTLEETVKKYVTVMLNPETDHLTERFGLEKAMQQALDSNQFTPDLFRTLILPLAIHNPHIDTEDRYGNEYEPATTMISWTVEAAITHPDCPIDVLTAVCRSPVPARAYRKPYLFPVWQYREVAATNPNCPEEDRVYVALDQGLL